MDHSLELNDVHPAQPSKNYSTSSPPLSKRHLYLGLSVAAGVCLYLISLLDTPSLIVAVLVFLLLGMVLYVSFRLFHDWSRGLLPTLLFLGGYLVLLFFPNFSQLFRILFSLIWIISFDVCLLAENVFSVAQERGVVIPLVRPAQTVSLLLTLLTSFLVMTGVFKSNLPFYLQALLSGVVVFLLGWHNIGGQLLGIGSALPEKSVLRRRALVASGWISLGLIELSLATSFFPQKSFFRALALTTSFYFGLGTYLHLMQHTLNRRVVLEYLGVVAVAYLLILVVGY